MERRSSERIAADFATTCRVPATPHRAKIVDVSHHGCRIELPDAPKPIGATVHFELGPRTRVSGQIVWATAGAAGVRFHRALATPAAIQLGLEQPPVQEVTIEPPSRETASIPTVLRHWVRRLCGLAT